jgi:hypothetical protein
VDDILTSTAGAFLKCFVRESVLGSQYPTTNTFGGSYVVNSVL